MQSLLEYLNSNVLNLMDREFVAFESEDLVKKRFMRVKDDLSESLIQEMRKNELFDEEGNLNTDGVNLFKELATSEFR